MKPIILLIAMPLAFLTGRESIDGRKVTTESDPRGFVTTELWQGNPKFGVFELKETDKSGKVNQWYQHFVDSGGKELIPIVRESQMTGPCYASIASISTYSYNKAGDVTEEYSFRGNGAMTSHSIYRYGWLGKWLQREDYDETGKFLSSSTDRGAMPEAHLYSSINK